MLIPLIKEEFSSIEDRATCGFSDEERELLISLLSRMREILTESKNKGKTKISKKETAKDMFYL